MKRIFRRVALVAMVLGFAGVQAASAAEERTVAAAAAWVSEGRFFLTGENEALFVGVLGGVLYVENAEGRLDQAAIICPGDFVIDLNSGAQEGEGKCIIEDKDGDNVFANWICLGQNFVGCAGEFVVTAGTGKFQGITGRSDLVARTAFSGIVVDLKRDIVTEASTGMFTLPRLTYTLP